MQAHRRCGVSSVGIFQLLPVPWLWGSLLIVEEVHRNGGFNPALRRGVMILPSTMCSSRCFFSAALSAPNEGWAPGQAFPSAQLAVAVLWVPPGPPLVRETFTGTSEHSSKASAIPGSVGKFKAALLALMLSRPCSTRESCSLTGSPAGWPRLPLVLSWPFLS